MPKHLIVSRHPAAIEFIRREAPHFADAPVIASVTADDVRGVVVAGNLPLHLAREAAEVWAVEFAGTPPRGTEYTLEDMGAAGARLTPYIVFRATDCSPQYEIWADGTSVSARSLKRMAGEREYMHSP